MVTMAKRDIWCAFHSHGFERVSKCLLHAYPIAQVVAREKGMPLSFVMELRMRFMRR